MRDSAPHLAVKERDVIHVCCLLANGAAPSVLDEKGAPPLAYASSLRNRLRVRRRDPRVGNAGQSLIDGANRVVTAAIEANEAHALAKMPGVK